MSDPWFNFDELAAAQASPEVLINFATRMLAAAIGGEIVIDFSVDDDYELEASDPPALTDEWFYAVIKMTDTGPVLSGPVDVLFPDVAARHRFVFINDTTEDLTVRRDQTSSVGVTIVAGDKAYLFHDGEDIVAIVNPLP